MNFRDPLAFLRPSTDLHGLLELHCAQNPRPTPASPAPLAPPATPPAAVSPPASGVQA